jgi:hypothetical protein
VFYEFTEGLSHATSQLPIIWEVETAISAVLTEANESESPMTVREIELQAIEVLGSRNLAPDMLAECRSELGYVSNYAHDLLRALVERLAQRTNKDALRVELKPDRDRILAGVKGNDEFAVYLRNSREKNRNELDTPTIARGMP